MLNPYIRVDQMAFVFNHPNPLGYPYIYMPRAPLTQRALRHGVRRDSLAALGARSIRVAQRLRLRLSAEVSEQGADDCRRLASGR